jgi:hypothetical protein
VLKGTESDERPYGVTGREDWLDALVGVAYLDVSIPIAGFLLSLVGVTNISGVVSGFSGIVVVSRVHV